MADDTSRPWKTSIENSLIRPRHRLGGDRRFLLCPIIFPCGVFGLTSRFPIQFYWYGLAFAFWIISQILWQMNPWLVDDFLAARRLAKWYVATPHVRRQNALTTRLVALVLRFA